MPGRTALGSRGKKRKEGARLCLELSKCGSSGPQSLYQCHSSGFFLLFFFFLPSICPGTILPLSQRRKNTHSHCGWLNTITSTLFPQPILLMRSLHSKIIFCLNAVHFSSFHQSSYLYKHTILKNYHTSLSLHVIPVHLTTGLDVIDTTC